jgi:hypothetical protein
MPKPEIFTFPQRSPEWYQVRAGLITASEYGAMLAKGDGKTRQALINRVAAEIMTGIPVEQRTNRYMDRGRELEPEVLASYALGNRCDPELVGFVKNGRTGCSPDAFVGHDGMIEIKTEEPDLLVETLRRNVVPTRHIPQCQGGLGITGRAWVDLVIYAHHKLPTFKKRITRDEPYIKRLRSEVDAANFEVDQLVKFLRSRM